MIYRRLFSRASGRVFIAKDLKTKKKVAIKQMVLRRQPRPDLIVTEVVLMQESRHPNIVNFVDSFLPRDENLWIVLEYMEGGPLTDVIDNNLMEEDQIAYVCKEVSENMFRRTALRLTRCFVDGQGSALPSRAEHHSPRHQV